MTSIDKIKNIFYVFWISVFVFAFLFLKLPKLFSNKKEAIAEIRYKSLVKSRVGYSYSVNGVTYKSSVPRTGIISENVEKGEQFIVEYDVKTPAYSTIKFNKPVVLQDSLFRLTYASNYEFLSRNKFIKYKYRVASMELERFQAIEKNDVKLIEPDKKLPVLYSIDDPQISYICVDTVNCWKILKKTDL